MSPDAEPELLITVRRARVLSTGSGVTAVGDRSHGATWWA